MPRDDWFMSLLADQGAAVRGFVPQDIRKSFDVNAEGGIKGSNAYRSWIAGHSDADAAAALREAGIPGIRYLDQGSRNMPISSMGLEALKGRLEQYKNDLAKGFGDPERMKYNIASIERELASYKPTHNYVIFPGNEHLIDIMRKYAVPPTAGGATMGGLAAQDRYAQ